MGNAAEAERAFRHKPSVYQLDNRVAVLESKGENVKKIENKLDKLDETMSQLSKELTEFVSAANARHKLWLFIFSLVSTLTVVLKIFGVDV